MTFWFDEMSRLSLVVGVGACAGWFASGAVLTSPAAAVEPRPAAITTYGAITSWAGEMPALHPLLPQRTGPRLERTGSRLGLGTADSAPVTKASGVTGFWRVAEAPDAATPAQRINYAPKYTQKPGACSLNPRDYADDTPIGAPETPDRHKNHGVACG